MVSLFGLSIAIETIYHFLIIFLSMAWMLSLFISIFLHRNTINFSSIILRTNDDGVSRVSKCGILFVFCLILIVVQTVTPNMVLDPQLVLLTTIALGTELTRQGMLTAMTYFKSKSNVQIEDSYDKEFDGNITGPKDMTGQDVSTDEQTRR